MISAVIVAYNSDKSLLTNIEVVAQQVDTIFLVDNSTKTEAVAFIQTIAETYKKITLLHLGGNLGLAKAQNLGIEAARKTGASWILLLDDDSLIPENMVSQMLDAAKHFEGENVGIVAPCLYDIRTQTRGRAIIARHPWHIWRIVPSQRKHDCIDALTVIASGSLIRTSVFDQVGTMYEPYFIDSLDTEFSLRVRAAGWRILIPKHIQMQHELGQKTRQQIAGIDFIASNHIAWRRYTMYRNRCDVWRRYLWRFPAYVIYDMMVAVYELVKIVALEDDKKHKFKNALLGLFHGFVGHFNNDNLVLR